MNDPLQTLNDILRRNGCNANLHENEGDRYFLFDKISEPKDIDLAWSQFPAHREIRRRAAEVDAVSGIVPGWGYRTPKTSNRCSDVELIDLVRQNIESLCPFISEDWDDVRAFIEDGYDIQLVGPEAESPPDAMSNDLFLALYESIGDWKIAHYRFEESTLRILYDWATFLTKCDEVALYLLWPVLEDIDDIDPQTPVPGFRLWQYLCRANYWINDDLKSRVVNVQRPWVP